jgi:hypothetical protein
MNSLTDLRDVVGVVIGVDTHVHTHSAAVLDTATGGVITAATLRVHSSWDVETTSTVVALRTLLVARTQCRRRDASFGRRSWPSSATGAQNCSRSHFGRIHSEAAFAMLAGVARIPANSGQITTRYRLNRYGDRNLNTALHTVVQIRIQYQQTIRDYIARRTAEGKTGREIKRCLPATSPATSTAYLKVGQEWLYEA